MAKSSKVARALKVPQADDSVQGKLAAMAERRVNEESKLAQYSAWDRKHREFIEFGNQAPWCARPYDPDYIEDPAEWAERFQKFIAAARELEGLEGTQNPNSIWSGNVTFRPLSRLRRVGTEQIAGNVEPLWVAASVVLSAIDNPETLITKLQSILVCDRGDLRQIRYAIESIIDAARNEPPPPVIATPTPAKAVVKKETPWLTPEHLELLRELDKAYPSTKRQVDIAVADRKKVGQMLAYLREHGLAHRPHGNHGGDAITERGRTYVAQNSPKNAAH